MEEATLDDSLRKVNGWIDFFVGQLPQGLSDEERRGFVSRIGEMLILGQQHIYSHLQRARIFHIRQSFLRVYTPDCF